MKPGRRPQTLNLSDCCLEEVPPCLAALAGTLTSLTLSCNAKLGGEDNEQQASRGFRGACTCYWLAAWAAGTAGTAGDSRGSRLMPRPQHRAKRAKRRSSAGACI